MLMLPASVAWAHIELVGTDLDPSESPPFVAKPSKICSTRPIGDPGERRAEEARETKKKKTLAPIRSAPCREREGACNGIPSSSPHLNCYSPLTHPTLLQALAPSWENHLKL